MENPLSLELISNSKAIIFEWDIIADEVIYYKDENAFDHEIQKIKKEALISPFIYPDDVPILQSIKASIQQGQLYASTDFRLSDQKQHYHWFRIHTITQYGKTDNPTKVIGVLYSTDKEMQLLEKLQFKAERDALTGLYNRSETEDKIKAYLTTNPEEWCALFMIDTDNFKMVNDTKGHMLGDMVLTELALGMIKIMRKHDIVGRIGGDEFTIFMKHIASRESALRKAEELKQMFEQLFRDEKRSIPVTCSIGIAVYPEDGTDFKTLYNHADQALYQAKKQGKNRCVMYDSDYLLEPGDHEATSYLGTAIDSEANTIEEQNNLLTDIFKILYRTEDSNLAINLTLKIVGKRFDVSRAYIFENSDDGRYCSNTYEWCNTGVQPEIANLQNVDYHDFGDYESLFNESSIFYCRDISKLNDEQKDLFQSQGIYSVLQVAFWREERFAGFIGFDECTGMRLWTQEEMDTLSLISQMMSTFLLKSRAQEWTTSMKLQIQTMLDAQNTYIYVIDQNTFELLYLSPKVKELKPQAQLGDFCYQALFHHHLPCSFCPLQHHDTKDDKNYFHNGFSNTHVSSMKWLGNDAYLLSFQYDPNTKLIEKNSQVPSETSLVDCIRWLTSSEYIEDSIEYVLKIIQDYYQSDRVYIIDIDETNRVVNNTYEICAEGVTPQIDKLQHIPLSSITFWMQQFEARGYIKVDSLDQLGEDRQQEYEILKAQNINSLMAIPLYAKDTMKGFLGIDDPKHHKKNFHYLKGLSYFLENEISKNNMRKNLEQMRYQDTLSGLQNRNGYMKYCDDYEKRMPAKIGLIFIDINGLRQLNDSRGHLYGDLMVSHVADKMKEFFPNEHKFRISGDEFIIVTETMDYSVFRKQLDTMKKTFTEDGHSIAAIGYTWSDLYSDIAVLFSNAERLMGIHKKEYYCTVKNNANENMPVFQGVVKAIANKEYLIYLQPIYNLQTEQADSAEVLVRYKESDGSISTPTKLIPMLERAELISNIDFFVMEETCKRLEKWNQLQLSDMKLAFNFSKITLFNETFLDQFWNIFHRYAIRPEQLAIEITETQELLNKKQLASLLKTLKSHGFSIALDNFGVGYSSYEFLMLSEFDLIRIDKGITQRCHEVKQGEVLLKHIVQLSHDMGIHCCAEGVETKEQFEFIEQSGCDYIQGYLIDKPLPINEFERKYRNK